uniref:Uncharacterized protein n=1 Tax=Glossina palpalis gambiensis TaxID=67801 RepID=A0A1B0AR94_9MUSC
MHLTATVAISPHLTRLMENMVGLKHIKEEVLNVAQSLHCSQLNTHEFFKSYLYRFNNKLSTYIVLMAFVTQGIASTNAVISDKFVLGVKSSLRTTETGTKPCVIQWEEYLVKNKSSI